MEIIKALTIVEASGFNMKKPYTIMLIVGRSGKQENSIEGDQLQSCRALS